VCHLLCSEGGALHLHCWVIVVIDRKGRRWSITVSIALPECLCLIDKSDCKLFRQATNPGHSLLHLFPQKPLPTDLTSFVRGNTHICFPLFIIRSLKIATSIGVYLNMYNLPLLTSCSLSLVFSQSLF